MRYAVPRCSLLSLLSLLFMACAAAPDMDEREVAVASQAVYANVTSYDLVRMDTATSVGFVYAGTDETCGNLYVKVYVAAGYEIDAATLCVSEEPFASTDVSQCADPIVATGPFADGQNIYWFTVPMQFYGDGHVYLLVNATVASATTHHVLGTAVSGNYGGQVTFGYVSCPPPPDCSVTQTCEPPPDYGCTLTQGFWKTHPDAWPVDSLSIGGQTYTKTQLIRIFKTAPKGDASLILAHQLIAAMLNVASGSGAPEGVMDAMDMAQDWMATYADGDGRLPYGVTSKNAAAAAAEAKSLAGTLDIFNNGDYGPLHCEDGGVPETFPE